MKTKQLVNILNKRSKETGRSQLDILTNAIEQLPKKMVGCRQPPKKDADLASAIDFVLNYAGLPSTDAKGRIRKVKRIIILEVA